MAELIRVTYVIPNLEIGGAETQLIRLINGLDRASFQPALICPFGFGPLKADLDPDVEALSLAIPDRRYAMVPGMRAIIGIRSFLESQKPDLVHAYLMPAYVPAAFATWTTRPPYLIASRRSLDTYRRRRSAALRIAAWAANRRIDLHLCNAEAVREVVIAEERVAPERTAVIHNGIDIPSGDDAHERPVDARGGRAAVIANFNANKRHADVIEATRLIVNRRPGFRLTLFGDGAATTTLERLIHDHGLEENIELAGATPQAAARLDGYDVSILASEREGLPNALLESMARGVPVVATRVGGVPELVRDGVDGTLVEVGRPDQIATAVLALLDAPDLRRRMGEAARSRVKGEFALETMVSRTQDLYRSLAGRPAEARFVP